LLDSISQLDKKRTAMSELVTNFFSAQIASRSFQDIRIALYLFDNSLAPPEAGIELGLGEALLQKSLARYSALLGRPLEPAQLKQLVKDAGDTGEWAQTFMARLDPSRFPAPASPQDPTTPTLSFLFDSLHALARAEGTGSQERKVL
jgi:DNA ligase-1